MTGALAIALGLASAWAAQGPAADSKGLEAAIAENVLTLKGQKLPFPCDFEAIEKLLGKPSRTVDEGFRYLIWDDLGIYAKQNTARKSKLTIGMEFALRKYEQDYSPRKPYAGKLSIDDSAVTADTDLVELSRAKKGAKMTQLGDLPIWDVTIPKAASLMLQSPTNKGKGVSRVLIENGRD